MRLVKAVLAYDGTPFKGWQVQPNGTTVQAVLEKALHKIHGRPVKVTAASRTDSGVHALGQVVHFTTDSRLSDVKLQSALNFNLPATVVASSVASLDKNFHARFDAKGKLYRYRIHTGRARPLFDRGHVVWLPHRLDVAAMRRGAKHLGGRHDFTAFSTPDARKGSKVRHLRSLVLKRDGHYLDIEVRADSFLYNMVRVIVGTLLYVGFGKLKPADVPRILASKDRQKAGPTADPKGLSLVKVYY